MGAVGNAVSSVGHAIGSVAGAAAPVIGTVGGALSPLGAIAGGVAGNTAGNAVGNLINKPSAQAPGAPGEDPQLMAIRNAQLEQAKKFREGLSQEQQKQADIARDDSRRALISEMRNIKTGANSRGLLYSGLKTGAEAGAKSEAASALSQKIALQNRQLEQQAQSLESGAITGNYTPVAQQQQIENINFNNQVRENLARNQAIGNIFGGVGSLGGLLLSQGKS